MTGGNAQYVHDELDGEGVEGVGCVSLLRDGLMVVGFRTQLGQVLRREGGEDQLRHGNL